MRPWLSLALASLLVPSHAFAQEKDEEGPRSTVFVESESITPSLARAKALEKEGDWRSLFELYQRLLATHPEGVFEEEPGRYVGLRQHIQRRLASYPAEAVEMYRELLEPDAEVLWERYLQEGDLSLLRQLAETYSITKKGHVAALRLAEASLERGEEQESFWLWMRLATDPQGSAAEHAQALLRTALLAQRLGYGDRIETLAGRLTPGLASEVVRLAGRQTTLGAAIALVRASRAPVLMPAAADDWPSIGGAPSNDRIGSGDALNEKGVWTWPNDQRPPADEAPPPPNVAFSPAIATVRLPNVPEPEQRVFHADGHAVVALGVADGRPRWKSVRCRWGEDAKSAEPFLQYVNSRFPNSRIEVALGCTVDGGMVLANYVMPPDGNWQSPGSSHIAAFDAVTGKAVWTSETGSLPSGGLITSPPVVRGDRLFAPVMVPGAEPQCWVGCWSVRTGKWLWRRDRASKPQPAFVCGAQRGQLDPEGQAASIYAAFLAEGGGRLYILTNLGAVACLSETDGEVLWITDYQIRQKAHRPLRASSAGEVINLPVLRGDTLYCVPRDLGRLLAFDTATGAMRWDPPREVEGAHTLVGLHGDDLLVLAERKGQNYLVTVPIDTEAKPKGASVQIEGGLQGRSFLTQKWAYVPAGKGLYRFDTRTGKADYDRRFADPQWKPKESSGHVVVAGDMVITAGRRICGMCSQRVRDSMDKKLYDSGLPGIWLKRARSYKEGKDYEAAAEDYERALSLAVLKGTRVAIPVAADIRRELAWVYLTWGGLLEKDRPDMAAMAYWRSAQRQDDPALRVEPLFALARVHEREKRWTHVVAVLSRALGEAPQAVCDRDGLRTTVADAVANRFRSLRKEAGAAAFADFDREAEEAAKRLDAHSSEAWRAWMRRYPTSPMAARAQETLLALAKTDAEREAVCLESGLLLQGQTEGMDALVGLAETAEKLGHVALERWALDALECGYGDVQKAAQYVGERRSKVGNDERPMPALSVPLKQVGLVKAPDGAVDKDTDKTALPFVTPVALEGRLPMELELRNVGGNVEARKPGTDEKVWTVTDDSGWLGIQMTGVSNAVRLDKVIADEPAAKAGLQDNDLVTEVAGVPVQDADHLIKLIVSHPNQEMPFRILRGSVPQEVRVRVCERGMRHGGRVDQALVTPQGTLLLRRQRRLQAVDAVNGKILWFYPGASTFGDSPLHVNDLFGCWASWGRVYVLSATWESQRSKDAYVRIACLDGATGAPLWERDMPGQAGPLVHLGTDCILVAAPGGELTVLDARTGMAREERLHAHLLTHGEAPAMATDGRVLCYISVTGTLSALDLARDRELWTQKLDAIESGDLWDIRCGEGVVAVARAHRGIEAFDAASGERKGEGKRLPDAQAALLTIAPGPLVLATHVVDGGWKLAGLDLSKGKEGAWELPFAGASDLEVSVAQADRVFVRITLADATHLVVSVNRDGKRDWEQAIPKGTAAPRVAAQGGRLCVSLDDQMLLYGR